MANDRRPTPAAPEGAVRVLRRDALRPIAAGAPPSSTHLAIRHAGAGPAARNVPPTSRQLPSLAPADRSLGTALRYHPWPNGRLCQRAVPFTARALDGIDIQQIGTSRGHVWEQVENDPLARSSPCCVDVFGL